MKLVQLLESDLLYAVIDEIMLQTPDRQLLTVYNQPAFDYEVIGRVIDYWECEVVRIIVVPCSDQSELLGHVKILIKKGETKCPENMTTKTSASATP